MMTADELVATEKRKRNDDRCAGNLAGPYTHLLVGRTLTEADVAMLATAAVVLCDRGKDIDTLLAEVKRLRNGMAPGRWFRINAPDGSLWMETSDGDEARVESTRTGWPLEQLFVSEHEEWRVVTKLPKSEHGA